MAGEVSITKTNKDELVLLDTADNGKLAWHQASTGNVVAPFDVSKLPQLAKSYDLCVTGKV